ncbi:MAG TPA: DsbA family protein [Candidatus Saccharimonadales bacterium]|nr:DsbA family protein [Candidatus Saccharimonadales bacterium]
MKKAPLKKSLSNIFKPTTSKDSFTIRVPRFKSGSLNAYMVFVIVIFAFLLGVLTNKVVDLQGKVNDMSKANTAPTSATALPSADPTPAGPVNVSVGNFPVRGDTNAKVTVIEFADFRCPFCEQWFQNVEPNLISDYVNTGKVKYYFRNYAFLGPASTLAAEAGECANDQGQFWAFHDYMYKNQPDESDTSMYTNDNLSQIAGNLGMDQSQFASCLSSKDASDKAAKDLSDGQKAGVSGTPTTFVNGVAIVGAVPYSQIKAAIDNALKN